VLLDVLDDVFLLYLALETAKGVLDRFALLDLDLGQNLKHPQTMVKRGKTLFPRIGPRPWVGIGVDAT
jgi:hypothetical protein